jgi:hypothetical protein
MAGYKNKLNGGVLTAWCQYVWREKRRRMSGKARWISLVDLQASPYTETIRSRFGVAITAEALLSIPALTPLTREFADAGSFAIWLSSMPSMLPASTASSREWADRLGTWTSALCVVHCLLTPVLLSFSTVVAHLMPAEESVHRSLALLGCIAGAAWFGDKLPSHAMEVTITFCGSGFMIAAHRLNHTFCKSCECSSKC